MKRMIVFMIGIVLLGLTGTVWAGDTLLKTLQNKGVLTEEEASAIMTEQEKERKSVLPKALEGLSVGGVAFIDYSAGITGKNGTDFNKFSLTRGYINVKKDITPWLKARVTPDVTQIADTLNSQKGDLELRMKYYYVDLLIPGYGLLTDNDLRVGLAQMPWIDFQEAINIYRMQGTMFQERFLNFDSGDLGIGLIGNLGGKLNKELQEQVGYATPYNGRYGSYHIGVYNGAGYHATEDNQNKVIEGRITIRPLPDATPGLQVTYLGISGKGNKAANPDWRNNSAFVSYQNRVIVLTGEYVLAKENQKGDDGKDKTGYSIFGDFRLPFYEGLAIMARYDVWDPDTDVSNNKEKLTIGGVSYRVFGNDYLLAAYEQRQYDNPGYKDDKKGQVVFQVNF
ncbi:MAG: hypothetical protein HZB32_03255 [Nitrospirae bacterium]|nr:hypothetical protein [Nitrospirota bacterium]